MRIMNPVAAECSAHYETVYSETVTVTDASNIFWM